MGKFNILHLHRLGDPRHWRESVRSLEYMIRDSCQDVNCIVHDTEMPFPGYLKEMNYHLIVLGPTFLCNRYYPSVLKKILHDYEFIASSSACKVALPQDDYDCSGILDQWMIDWNVDLVYTVCPEHWEILYPNYSQKGLVRLGYTGYISESWLHGWSTVKPFDDRTIDVSYRASRLPANFGSLGQLKSDIAERFVSSLPSNHLHLDISVDSKDIIVGELWHDFMEDSKFCLVTPSGSSLLDPQGEFRTKVSAFCRRNPAAKFSEIANACFPNQDGKIQFTAVSPRNIEAALSETVQIATHGTYSRLLKPLEHFIPLKEDCSNIELVLEQMKDVELIKRVRRHCKEAVLAEPRLRAKNIVREIIDFAENTITNRHIQEIPQSKINYLLHRYYCQVESNAELFWRKKRFFDSLKNRIKTKFK